MFQQVDVGKSTSRWAYYFFSGTLQAVILGILILIPLIYTEALPKGFMNTFLVAPAPPPPPPPPAAPEHIVHAPPRIIPLNKMVAPTVIPKKIEVAHDTEAPDMGGVQGGIGVPGGVPGGVLGGIIGGAAPPPPPAPATPARVRIGGNVEAGQLTDEVRPQYPPIAKAARIQGTVVLHAIISKQGTIEQLTYISGPAMLEGPAMAAVRQWRYKPYLLNGQPVEVDTTIDVEFDLSSN